MTFDVDNLRPRFTWSGDGDSDVLRSLAARAYFNGKSEDFWPAAPADIGKKCADLAIEIAAFAFFPSPDHAIGFFPSDPLTRVVDRSYLTLIDFPRYDERRGDF